MSRAKNMGYAFSRNAGKLLYVMQYFSWQGGRPIWQDGLLLKGEQGGG